MKKFLALFMSMFLCCSIATCNSFAASKTKTQTQTETQEANQTYVIQQGENGQPVILNVRANAEASAKAKAVAKNSVWKVILLGVGGILAGSAYLSVALPEPLNYIPKQAVRCIVSAATFPLKLIYKVGTKKIANLCESINLYAAENSANSSEPSALYLTSNLYNAEEASDLSKAFAPCAAYLKEKTKEKYKDIFEVTKSAASTAKTAALSALQSGYELAKPYFVFSTEAK